MFFLWRNSAKPSGQESQDELPGSDLAVITHETSWSMAQWLTMACAEIIVLEVEVVSPPTASICEMFCFFAQPLICVRVPPVSVSLLPSRRLPWWPEEEVT